MSSRIRSGHGSRPCSTTFGACAIFVMGLRRAQSEKHVVSPARLINDRSARTAQQKHSLGQSGRAACVIKVMCWRWRALVLCGVVVAARMRGPAGHLAQPSLSTHGSWPHVLPLVRASNVNSSCCLALIVLQLHILLASGSSTSSQHWHAPDLSFEQRFWHSATMPKRTTLTYTSYDAPKTEETTLVVYYCKYSGKHAFTTGDCFRRSPLLIVKGRRVQIVAQPGRGTGGVARANVQHAHRFHAPRRSIRRLLMQLPGQQPYHDYCTAEQCLASAWQHQHRGALAASVAVRSNGTRMLHDAHLCPPLSLKYAHRHGVGGAATALPPTHTHLSLSAASTCTSPTRSHIFMLPPPTLSPMPLRRHGARGTAPPPHRQVLHNRPR